MATTHIPNLDEPLDPNLDLEKLYETLKEWTQSAQWDSDKADTTDEVCWYDGLTSMGRSIMNLMQGHNPDYPETSDEEYAAELAKIMKAAS